ncbi:MAG: aminotransferase class III-fold pyridoxal phosphate-dependent enzyme [Verrucomicrobiota bacterium]|nr:aminotransferase class III-fold pyridoxal phosphate-dependent enzyme [Verrucomicrobiota bacterium]
MNPLAQLDHKYIWHPFTQMKDWLKREPILITSGKGAVLRDVHGQEYLDANSSIWTNLHGHAHPKINSAIQRQLKKISHSSALGCANEPASLLAEKLVKVANPANLTNGPASALNKVFFSDDGSTAMEVALKLAYEFARRSGQSKNPKFLSLHNAYHGDTIGAVSLGHIDLFNKSWTGLRFKTDKAFAPYCYRCPFNRAKPQRADARTYRKCSWECVGQVEQKFSKQKKKGNPYAAFVVEPLMQGAAGMIPQPSSWLHRVNEIVRGNGAQLIADEVMTGFGRTGLEQSAFSVQHSEKAELKTQNSKLQTLFACHHENVQPDFLAVAKGLTGGYLPMAATLTTQKVFDAFLGEYDEFKTFFHGHSFTGNQLGAAAAGASLDLLTSQQSIRSRQTLEQILREELKDLWRFPNVGDIRQVGLVVGIELVKNWKTREPFALEERVGMRVCETMAQFGVLTRPIGNVIVLMPPYCATKVQTQTMVRVLGKALVKELKAIL